MKEIARSVLGPRLKPATLPSRASTRSSKITQSAALPAKVDGPTAHLRHYAESLAAG